MTSQAIKEAMSRHDISSVKELHGALKEAGYALNYTTLTQFVSGSRKTSAIAALVLKLFFSKLDKEKSDWSREKIDELRSEIENDI